jgi:hypothetical protein
VSYSRADSKGRHYIWMGTDGLHLMPNARSDTNDLIFKNGDKVSIDNAEALLSGLVDFLASNNVKRKRNDKGGAPFRCR